MSECTVDGCSKRLQAKGYCAMHYARVRNFGSINGRPRRETCSVNECTAPPRSAHADYCETHYYRLRRTGTTDERPIVYVADEIRAARERAAQDRRNEHRREQRLAANPNLTPRRRLSGPCLVEGCEKPMEVGVNGYCRMHNLREKTRGDLNFEYGAENHHAWTGEEATYWAVHQRVRSERGSAAEHTCVDCGRPAAHWSYDRTDPEQRHSKSGGPYSTDTSRYHPRCVSCHKRFDMAHVMRERRAQ